MPRSLGDVFWNVTYFCAWVTLPYTVLSILHQLDIVVRWMRALLGALPGYRDFLEAIGRFLEQALAIWREVTGPVHALLVQLHIPLSQQLTDLAMLALLIAPSLFRYVFQSSRLRAAVAAHRNAENEIIKRRATAESGSARGGFGVAGGLIGLLASSVLGPIGPALGVLAGNVVGGLVGSAERDPHDVALSSKAEAERLRVEQARRRLGQAMLLLRTSIAAGVLVLGLFVASWYYGGRAMCPTQRAVGDVCSCVAAPSIQGIARPGDESASRNLCYRR